MGAVTLREVQTQVERADMNGDEAFHFFDILVMLVAYAAEVRSRTFATRGCSTSMSPAFSLPPTPAAR